MWASENEPSTRTGQQRLFIHSRTLGRVRWPWRRLPTRTSRQKGSSQSGASPLLGRGYEDRGALGRCTAGGRLWGGRSLWRRVRAQNGSGLRVGVREGSRGHPCTLEWSWAWGRTGARTAEAGSTTGPPLGQLRGTGLCIGLRSTGPAGQPGPWRHLDQTQGRNSTQGPPGRGQPCRKGGAQPQGERGGQVWPRLPLAPALCPALSSPGAGAGLTGCLPCEAQALLLLQADPISPERRRLLQTAQEQGRAAVPARPGPDRAHRLHSGLRAGLASRPLG